MDLNPLLTCLYFLVTVNFLKARVFIASTASDKPKTGSGSGWDPVRMPELWIWTLHPETPTSFHPTMWICNPVKCDGFILDLGGRILINTLELGKKISRILISIFGHFVLLVQGVFWDDAGVRDFKLFSSSYAGGTWNEESTNRIKYVHS